MLKTGKYKQREISCNQCGILFITNSPSRKFCSKTCSSKSYVKLKTCPVCTKQYPSDPNTKYCSVECYQIGRPSRKGIKLSSEWKKALSEGRKKSDKCKGPNLYNWKGGKKTESQRFRIHNQNRRKNLSKKLDKLFITSLFLAQKGKCFYCESKLIEYKSLDHLTSIKNGGDNQNYNLVWACKRCNSKKRSENLEEYAIKIGNLFLVDKWDIVFTTALVIKDKLLRNHASSRIQKDS